jgi:tRNA/tmRNA/rRNA uracil-C5-methylase (TrmA/RlmC/RlmD family)
VARHGGLVLFVRHALPGEVVRAQVTESRDGQRFVRADAVEVLRPSAHRVEPPCPWAAPGRCGGCDFQHADLAYQRELKAAVVREQFSRLARLDVDVPVEPVPGDRDGLRWRTRVEFAVDGSGRAGLRKHRSHDVVPVDDCLIADPRVVGTGVLGRSWPGERAVDVVAPSTGADALAVPVPSGEREAPTVRERVEAASWSGELEVGARGFWQVHPGAAALFVGTVLDWLGPQPGERAVDLYAGVGLFAAALADAVGDTGAVLAVESEGPATAHARANLAARDWVEIRTGRVEAVLRPLVRQGIRADLVVLDPPRTGAGRVVVGQVAALRPRAVAYVACDPAALARDTAYLVDEGYALARLRALDAFPMTHHLECLALFEQEQP